MIFDPSPKFAGSKPGMVFKMDAKGLGYYKDVKPRQFKSMGNEDASLIFSKRVDQDASAPYIIVRDSKKLEYDSPEACQAVSEKGYDSPKIPLYNVHLLRHFVETVWKIERPQVIISVTGGAQAFDLSSKKKDIIMKGMMDGTRNLKALFITGGTNAGIMRYVGEARAKYNPTAPLIGIAALGPLKGGPRLLDQWTLNEGQQKRRQLYDTVKEEDENDRKKKGGKPGSSELDKHHSHFILVHDEDSKAFGDENALRAEFEGCMSAPKQDIVPGDGADSIIADNDASPLDATSDGDGIPIVSVCVQGGPGSIATIAGSVEISRPSCFRVSEHAHGLFRFSMGDFTEGVCMWMQVRQGIPALVVRGSGKASDLLADVVLLFQHRQRPVSKAQTALWCDCVLLRAIECCASVRLY